MNIIAISLNFLLIATIVLSFLEYYPKEFFEEMYIDGSVLSIIGVFFAFKYVSIFLN